MKTKKPCGKIALFVAIALLMTSLLVPAAYAFPYLSTTPVPVYGRILTPDRTGDSANWIEVAQNGPYSLIVRQTFISWRPNYLNYNYYNDPKWQAFGHGATPDYRNSYIRDMINCWFNDKGDRFTNYVKYPDSLHLTARIRNFTMYNNATQVLGTNCKEISFRDGYSAPSPVKTGFGDDVAFALSFTEATNFISTGADIRTAEGYRMSNPYAQMNYRRLNIPIYDYPKGDGYTGMWLRTTGDCANTMGTITSGRTDLDRRYDGRVFQMHGSPQYWNICVYPALWVDSAIFDTNHPITVNYYKDSVSSANYLGSDSLPAQAAGTAITDVDRYKFAPAGYKVPGELSGATIVAAGENIVNVVYKPDTPKSIVYVQYYKDYVGGTYLGIDQLTLDLPAGVNLLPYIDAKKYAPPNYEIPGTVSGQLTTQSGGAPALVFVVYDKPLVAVKRDVYVIHQIQPVRGIDLFVYHSMDIVKRDDGELIQSKTLQKSIPNYVYYDANPPQFTVGEFSIVTIRYIINPDT